MGFHGFSMGSLLLVLLIAVVVFGTKRLRYVAQDIGAAVKGFRKGMQDEPDPVAPSTEKNTLLPRDETP